MQNALLYVFYTCILYVSPVFQGTHQVSENTTLSIFLHTQISKKRGCNGADTDLKIF